MESGCAGSREAAQGGSSVYRAQEMVLAGSNLACCFREEERERRERKKGMGCVGQEVGPHELNGLCDREEKG
jgi:hypothetical protein